mgnify:CR=1 FL=1
MSLAGSDAVRRAILVLTGEATESDIAELGPADPGRPDLVLKDLAALTGIL